MIRAVEAQLVTPMTMTMTSSVRRIPNSSASVPTSSRMIGARMSASTKVGNTRKKSVMRMSTVSSQPPTNPATIPMTDPSRTVTTVASRPITIEMRVPCTVRLRMSRPISSVPSRCAALGGSSTPPLPVVAVSSGPTNRSGATASTTKTVRIASPSRPSGRRVNRRAKPRIASTRRRSRARPRSAGWIAGALTSGPAGQAVRRPGLQPYWPVRPRPTAAGRSPAGPGSRARSARRP